MIAVNIGFSSRLDRHQEQSDDQERLTEALNHAQQQILEANRIQSELSQSNSTMKQQLEFLERQLELFQCNIHYFTYIISFGKYLQLLILNKC